MKKTALFALAALLLFSCNNSGSSPSVDTGKANPEDINDDMDVAIVFIKDLLNGRHEEAKKYMLNDSTNLQYCDAMQRNYEKMDRNKKEEFKLASIQDMKKEKLNDSVVIVNYKNSYEKQPYQLKLVRNNNQWLVDLKYSFQNKPDSLK